MKILIKSIALAILTVTAQAANVSLIPAPSKNLVTSNLQAVPVGSYAVVGFFAGFLDTAADRLALSDATNGIRSYVSQKFVPLGQPSSPLWADKGVASTNFGTAGTVGVTLNGTVPNQYISASGSINNTALVFAAGTANALVVDGVTRGTRLFLLVYNSADPATATELGIYSATTWVVPAAGTTASLPLASIDNATAAYEVYRGGLGSLILAPIIPVPEPATGLLTLIVGLGLIGRRRR